MTIIEALCFILACIFPLIINSVQEVCTESTYTVATVEYEPVIPENAKPIEILLENANRYAEYAAKAALKNAKIIVFPEFGLSSLENLYSTREELIPFTQDVPDPTKVSWNPCLNPDQYNNSQILHILSCAAHNNSIALLANLISHETCIKSNDSNCPNDGFYLFNSNIVFNKSGTLVARYHKHHLFFEPLLNAANEPEYTIFDIDGIKFATFICFDIYYEDPAIKLITQKGIKNIIFSTAWGNMMPFITGLQVFSRWAQGLEVNLIVSNYYKPQYGRLGTGIYSSQKHAIAETFDISKNGSLLIANLPTIPSSIPEDHSTCSVNTNLNDQSSQFQNTTSYIPFEMTDIPSSKPVSRIHKIFYQSIVNYTKLALSETEQTATLCHQTICCMLTYEMFKHNDSATYALVTYDGIQVIDYFHAGTKSCSVMRCENINDIETCAQLATTNPSTIFRNITLIANLDEKIVFPSIINTDMQLVKNWDFSHRNCSDGKSEWIVKVNEVHKLKSLTIFARVYSRDRILSK